MNHLDAKAAVDQLGLSPLESLFIRGVAWHETNYGQGWKPGAGAGSYNMGAITTAKPDSLSFRHVDSKFDPKQNKVVQYTTWFAGYPDAKAGFAALAKQVLKPNVKEALAKGSVEGGVQAMYDNRYFLGIHKDPKANVAAYFEAVGSAIKKIIVQTAEKVAGAVGGAGGVVAIVLTLAALVGGLMWWRRR